jgi:hypothetical protein
MLESLVSLKHTLGELKVSNPQPKTVLEKIQGDKTIYHKDDGWQGWLDGTKERDVQSMRLGHADRKMKLLENASSYEPSGFVWYESFPRE